MSSLGTNFHLDLKGLPPDFSLFRGETEDLEAYQIRLCQWADVWVFNMSGVRKRLPDGCATEIWLMYDAIRNAETMTLVSKCDFWRSDPDFHADTYDGMMIRVWIRIVDRVIEHRRLLKYN